MNTNAQILFDQLPTAATAFAGVARVNQYDTAASLSRFARRVLYQLIPRGIRNAFCQAVVFEPARDIQIFKCDDTETIDQIATLLMRKVRTPVRYPRVDLAKQHLLKCVFFPILGLLCRVFSSLHTFQIGFITPKETRVCTSPSPHAAR